MIAELIFLGVISSVYSQSLHHTMTPEELDSIFSVKSHSEVPEYDVVPVSVVQSRKRRDNGLYISTERFGKHIKAWLNPMDGILAGEKTPVHFLGENSQNRYYPNVRTVGDMLKEILPDLYENHLHATTLAVNRHSNGKRSVRGFIGDTHIQPVPSHLMDHAKRHRRSVKGSLDEESDHENYHIVRKIPKLEGIHYSPPIEAFTNLNRTRRSSENDQVKIYPEIIYPEILVIVDYPLLTQFKGQWIELLVYVLTFWNGVDMRYRDIVHPRVRFNIHSIAICINPNLLPYIQAYGNGQGVDIDRSLSAKIYWLKRMSEHFGYETYDIAVTMTTYDLCSADSNGCNILGVASLNGACTYHNVALVKDTGGFGGIMTTAHELGHAFGMKHDDQSEMNCNDKVGNVMAPAKTNTPDSYVWSYCSLRDFQDFIVQQGDCLTNPPAQQKPLYKFMPGMLMNANKQCEMIVGRGVKAYRIDDSICTQLQCTVKTNYPLPEAADGTTCDRGKMCLHGLCTFVSTINK